MARQSRELYFKKDLDGDVCLYEKEGRIHRYLKWFCEDDFNRLFPKIKVTKKYKKVIITITEM